MDLAILAGKFEWMDDSLCKEVDPELFFPSRKGDKHSVAAAKAVCMNCDVRQQCYDYAIGEVDLYGVWGGTSLIDRRAIRGDVDDDEVLAA